MQQVSSSGNSRVWDPNLLAWVAMQQPILNAGSVTIPGAVDVSDRSARLLGQVSTAFSSRSDTFTTTGNGTIVAPANPLRVFSITVKGTGAGATSWDVRLEGSIDGVNFTTILQHITASVDGATIYSGGLVSPSLFFRSRVAALSLSPATNIVVTILGQQ